MMEKSVSKATQIEVLTPIDYSADKTACVLCGTSRLLTLRLQLLDGSVVRLPLCTHCRDEIKRRI